MSYKCCLPQVQMDQMRTRSLSKISISLEEDRGRFVSTVLSHLLKMEKCLTSDPLAHLDCVPLRHSHLT